MLRSTDGFEIAEMDLRLRLWTGSEHASGLPDLALALADDAAVLEDARAAGECILKDDPDLGTPSCFNCSRTNSVDWQVVRR